MRKIIVSIISVALILGLCSCGKAPSTPAEQSMDAFKAFLKNKQELVVANDSEYFTAGESFRYKEFKKAFLEYVHKYDDDSFAVDSCDISYAYIDCGADGIPELVLQFDTGVSADPASYGTYDFVINCKDGALSLVQEYESFYRHNTFLYNSGIVEYYASDGLFMYENNFRYINGDGTESFLYSADCSEGDFMFLNSGMLPEGFASEGYFTEPASDQGYTLYVCKDYCFTDDDLAYGSDEYKENHIFTISSFGDAQIGTPEEYASFYEDYGIRIVTEDEAAEIVRKHCESLGMNADMQKKEEITFTKFDSE